MKGILDESGRYRVARRWDSDASPMEAKRRNNFIPERPKGDNEMSDERLAVVETSLKEISCKLDMLAMRFDKLLDERTEDRIEIAKVKMQMKILAGVLAVLVLGGGGVSALLKMV